MKNVLFCLLTFFSITIFAQQAGSLDSTFGINGKVVTDYGSLEGISAVAIQNDGKILVAGSGTTTVTRDFVISRYYSNGTIDSTFGTNGVVTTDFDSTFDAATSIAIQPDGKFVVAGSESFPGLTGFMNIALARYNSNGTLDTSFSGDGKIIKDWAGYDSYARSVIIHPNGKITVAGAVDLGFEWHFGIEKYNANGTYDGTFSGPSTATFWGTNSNTGTGSAAALQADDKVVMVGNYADTVMHIGIARFTIGGVLDNTFGINGSVAPRFTFKNEEAWAVVIQPDSEILVAGRVDTNFALFRLHTNGALDSTFGNNGLVQTDFSLGGIDIARAVTLQPDGKIIVAGTANSTNFALARYHTNGTLDSTFGINGKVIIDFTSTCCDQVSSLVLKPDGHLLVAGQTHNGTNYDFALADCYGFCIPTSSTIAQTICQGESYLFNGTALTATGTYHDTLENVKGCDSIITLTLSVNPSPTSYFVIYPDSVNQGVYYGFNQSTGNSLTYLWYFGDGDSSMLQYPSHTYAAPGQYYICLTVSDSLDCSNTYCDSSFYVFKTEGGLMSQLNILDPNAPLNVIATTNDLTISIHPNPATSQLFILSNGSTITEINIYNTTGVLVSQTKKQLNNYIDISQLAEGVYIAEMKTKEASVRKRWVKM